MPDDDFDLDGEADGGVTEPSESDPFKQLRAHSRKLERQLKERDKELDELRAFRQDQEKNHRQSQVTSVLTKLGLPEKHAELFAAVRADVEPSEANVKAFAEEYGLLAKPEGDDSETGGFAPAPPAGLPTGSKRLSSDEWHSLYKESPGEALKALQDRRVDLKTSL